MTIVLESLAFWELAGDELVDPDAAAEQVEGAVNALGKMSPEEKVGFVEFVRAYADEEEAEKGSPERIEFFRSLPENFGLIEK
jgi:hypothetical protein